MEDEELNSDFFQSLFKFIRKMLEPATAIFGDADARNELLGTLGLDSDTDIGELPSTTALDRYIESAVEDLDGFALAGAVSDLVQLTVAIEGVIRAALNEEEDAGFALDEIMAAFFNILLMEYIRRNNPPAHAFAQLVTVINANSAAIGGSEGIAKTIGSFFKRLASGLDTPESAEALTQTIFAALAGGFLAIDHFAIKDSEVFDLRLDYGFDAYRGSSTPNLDAIADRALTYSIAVAPHDNPANRGEFFNTLAFVPETHGGGALVTELAGEVDLLIPVEEDASFKIDVDGDGVFRIGTRPAADLGKANKLAVTFKHKLPKDFKTKFFPTPEILLGIKEYAAKFTLKPDDFDINFKVKMPFEMKRDREAGFPGNLLPKTTKKDIDLEFGYSEKRDFYFGSGGGNPKAPVEEGEATEETDPATEPNLLEKVLEKLFNLIDLRIEINKDIKDVVGIEVLHLKTGANEGLETITIESSLDFWVKFTSAVKVSISRLGAEMVFTEREDNGGFLGYDLNVDFKPPTGAGLAVNAGPIGGGGYLYFDKDKGEYFGALEFLIKDVLTIKAVGVINTIMPDGSDGFSMLVLVSGEYAVPLQFGFFLNGLGGLMGIDRTINVEALRVGVRTNAINSIMFPEDVVGNISRIINDIQDFFPIKEDQFAVGLMARIGYGGTNLLLMDLGVIVEWPDPKIIILGVIRISAPREDSDTLRLQVNFLGVIDTVNQFVYFEAQLYDSQFVGIELTGSLAFVAGWGDNGMFAISIGGFHPDFNDYPTVPTLPGAFRDMDRVGLSLLSGKNPTLTLQFYVAYTSNSFQFGARLELLASGPANFNLYGLLAFDALFIFDPFSFSLTLEATLAIRRKRKILFGISFRGTLTGPHPWNIDGEVSFGILFFDITIPVRATWGNELEEIASTRIELTALLRQELENRDNWQGRAGKRLHHTVTHRELDRLEDSTLVVYPFGELGFGQDVLPLNYDIEKFGDKVPEGANRIGISAVRIGDEVLPTQKRKALFAAGNFTKLSENEKLSRKSFERFENGFTLQGTQSINTSPRTVSPVTLDYELNYTEDDPAEAAQVKLPLDAFRHLVRGAGASASTLSWSNQQSGGPNALQTIQIDPDPQQFAIASTATLREANSADRFSTLAEATRALDAVVANDPDMEGQLQVVQTYELAG
ncbi:MAG: DUF6603 domain-containing protein [Pseudomonadota bacterium]